MIAWPAGTGWAADEGRRTGKAPEAAIISSTTNEMVGNGLAGRLTGWWLSVGDANRVYTLCSAAIKTDSGAFFDNR